MKVVLVHGGWQGGWAWHRVAPILRSAGHEVFTPTLRGLDEGEGQARHRLVQHIGDVQAVDGGACGHGLENGSV